MNKIQFFILLLSFAYLPTSTGQLFNIVKEETVSSNPLRLSVNGNEFVISDLASVNEVYTNYSYRSNLLNIELFDTILVSGVVTTRNGVLFTDTSLFIMGPTNTGVGLAEYDLESDMSQSYFFTSPDGSSEIGAANFHPPFVYSTTTVAESEDRENLLLRKVDINNGDLLEEYLVFDDDIIRPFCYEILADASALFLSSTVGYEGQFGSYDHLIKMDLAGNKIWEHRGSKKLRDGGASKTYITELSNGNIVQVHKDDKDGNIEFFQNGWNPFPSLLRWFSPEGEIIKEEHILSGRKDILAVSQLETGAGDYFYAYGRWSKDLGDDIADDEDGVGFIAKYTNDGDTLWVHEYRHPDYNSPNNYHGVLDIEELPNGDILALGSVFPEDGGFYTWLFRVNEHGCFTGSDCEGIVTSVLDTSKTTDLQPICLFYLRGYALLL